MEPFTQIHSAVISLPVDNIDTDQIIPARYMKITDKKGLGKNLFNDWRYDSAGDPRPDFVLNQPASQGREILFAGDNFGCGSSREHAPWALTGWGIRAVISTLFADIFRNNSLKNGLLPIQLSENDYRALQEALAGNPDLEITIDLSGQEVILPDGRAFPFPINSFSKTCLLQGVDELGYLLGHMPQIEAFESRT